MVLKTIQIQTLAPTWKAGEAVLGSCQEQKARICVENEVLSNCNWKVFGVFPVSLKLNNFNENLSVTPNKKKQVCFLFRFTLLAWEQTKFKQFSIKITVNIQLRENTTTKPIHTHMNTESSSILDFYIYFRIKSIIKTKLKLKKQRFSYNKQFI